MLFTAACGGSPQGDRPDGGGSGGDAGADADPGDGPVDPGPEGDPLAALAALPGLCSADGWCWRWPAPHGNDYVRVFSTATNNIWLTARQGTVMQWNGYVWTSHHPPVLPGQERGQFPMSIGGSGPKNMWLIFGNTVQQWDGSSWAIRDTLPGSGNPGFNNVWVAPDGDAWVTQSNGVLKRFRAGVVAQTYTPCGGCFLGSIWGTAGDDLFITTLPAGILHFDGQMFAQSYAGPNILGGFSGKKGDVWASGGSGHVMRWNGAAWTEIQTPPETVGKWTAPAGYTAENDVWWWVLDRPGFLHWDGAVLSYTAVNASQDGGLPSMQGAIIDGRWWLVGDAGAVYTRTGPDTVGAVVMPMMRGLLSMWGSAETAMYFAFGSHIKRWDGATLTSIPIRAQRIGGVRVNGVDELFGAGLEQAGGIYTTTALHFDGTSWLRTDLETNPVSAYRAVTQVHALGPGEAIAVGSRGLAYYFTAGSWRRIETGTTADLYGVWGPDASHAWIAGKGGKILRWSREAPDVVVPDPSLVTAMDLGPIHGADGTAWLAQPQGSMVWRNDGEGWTSLPAVTVGNAETGGLFAVSKTNVVLSSGAQTLTARWNGVGFAREDNASGVPKPLLFKPPGGKMLAGWVNGGIVEHP